MNAGPAPVTLVLGGIRSGKSRYAENLLRGRPGERVYLATAEPGDAEMAARIAAHRARRDEGWITVEEPLELVAALQEHARPGRVVLVECLTLWLTNLLGAGRNVERECAGLVAVLPALASPVVFVSNEVGLGLVAESALGRRFVDCAGRLHQDLAAAVDRVVFVAAGLPLDLKGAACAPEQGVAVS